MKTLAIILSRLEEVEKALLWNETELPVQRNPSLQKNRKKKSSAGSVQPGLFDNSKKPQTKPSQNSHRGDRSHLQKKLITDKNGIQRTVWVNPNKSKSTPVQGRKEQILAALAKKLPSSNKTNEGYRVGDTVSYTMKKGGAKLTGTIQEHDGVPYIQLDQPYQGHKNLKYSSRWQNIQPKSEAKAKEENKDHIEQKKEDLPKEHSKEALIEKLKNIKSESRKKKERRSVETINEPEETEKLDKTTQNREETLTNETPEREAVEDLAKSGIKVDQVEPSKAFLYNTKKSVVEHEFRDYGAWKSNGKSLTKGQRKKANAETYKLLNKNRADLTAEDLDTLRQYSGFGGLDKQDERGVLYDYYTDPQTALGVHKLLNKIRPMNASSEILEPSCGTGVFIETLPDTVHSYGDLGSIVGVELDPRTASIADILQGDISTVKNQSFEDFNLANQNKFTHVVGNCPFGDRDAGSMGQDMPEERSLDKYFLKRGLENLQGDGVIGMIAQSGLMTNKNDRRFRVEMLQRGKFLGAYRIPNTSFDHAHTGVAPVIYLFQRHQESHSPLLFAEEEQLKAAGVWNNDFVEGKYFDANPDKLLGEKAKDQWGNESQLTGEWGAAQIDAMVDDFKPLQYEVNEDPIKSISIPNPKPSIALSESEASALKVKKLNVGDIKAENGHLYRLNQNHRWERIRELEEEEVAKVGETQAISRRVKKLREVARIGESTIELQRQIREDIQDYKNKYGVEPASDNFWDKIIKDNPSIRGVHEAVGVTLDGEFLNAPLNKEIEIKDGHQPDIQALNELRGQYKQGTPSNIDALFGGRAESLQAAMQKNPDVFWDGKQWLLREDMIEGNAWEKIDSLAEALQSETDKEKQKKIQYGIDELQQAAGWISADEVTFDPRQSFIPDSLREKWIASELNLKEEYIKIQRKNDQGEDDETAKITEIINEGKIPYNKYYDKSEVGKIRYFLNYEKQRSKHEDTDVYNETAISNFNDWLGEKEERINVIEDLYNRTYGGEIEGLSTRTYSVDIAGWNYDEVTLKGHQWQTIHKLMGEGKGISALGVGFGKTLSAVGLVGLGRQEGRFKRPLVQVPNNKVVDWVEEFNRAMPGLKIGAIDLENKKYNKQDVKFQAYQELANGDYDVLILPESAAKDIALSAEEDKAITDTEVYSQLLDAAKKTARQKQIDRDNAELKLETANKNTTISFEDLRADAYIVDEAHRGKNLWNSSLGRELGMNDGGRSQRALEMFKKAAYIRKQNDNKNVFLFTATPLTNSPLEYYNMLSHIGREDLEKMGIRNLDQFIRNFAVIETANIAHMDGKGGKEKKLMKGFKNLNKLRSIFFRYTDLQNDPKKIGLEKPEANIIPNTLQKDDVQAGAVGKYFKKFQDATKSTDEEEKRKVLHYYTKIRAASLDPRLADPEEYKGWKNPKITKMVDNIKGISKHSNGGHIVFCDRVLSADDANGSFNMHDEVKKQLVAAGYKPDEVGVLNGITKAGKKQTDNQLQSATNKIVKDYNSGKLKVLIGTTATMGEGLNLQANSVSLHHLDFPYRPSDIIQRNGRIDRQGNQQATVQLHNYMSAGTSDAYSMNIIQTKANWIDDLLNSKSNVFTNPEEESNLDTNALILALTEELDTENDAAVIRQKIQEQREKAAKESQQKAAAQQAKQLETIRNTKAIVEDKGSRRYQNMNKKEKLIKERLRANPYFPFREALDNDKFFVYRNIPISLGTKIGYKHEGFDTHITAIDPHRGIFSIDQAVTLGRGRARREFRIDEMEKVVQSLWKIQSPSVAKWKDKGTLEDGMSPEQAAGVQSHDTDKWATTQPEGFIQPVSVNMDKHLSKVRGISQAHEVMHYYPESQRAEAFAKKSVEDTDTRHTIYRVKESFSDRVNSWNPNKHEKGEIIYPKKHDYSFRYLVGFQGNPEEKIEAVNPYTPEGAQIYRDRIDHLKETHSLADFLPYAQYAPKEVRDHYKQAMASYKKKELESDPKVAESLADLKSMQKQYGNKINMKRTEYASILQRLYGEESVEEIRPQRGAWYDRFKVGYYGDDYNVDRIADLYGYVGSAIQQENGLEDTQKSVERIWIKRNFPPRNGRSSRNPTWLNTIMAKRSSAMNGQKPPQKPSASV